MNQMLITYIVCASTGLMSIASIIYFIKNKRFIGRNILTTVGSIIVFVLCLVAIFKGIPITQLQYLLEN